MKDLTIKKCNNYITKFTNARKRYGKSEVEYGELTDLITKYRRLKEEIQGDKKHMEHDKKLLDIHEDV